MGDYSSRKKKKHKHQQLEDDDSATSSSSSDELDNSSSDGDRRRHKRRERSSSKKKKKKSSSSSSSRSKRKYSDSGSGSRENPEDVVKRILYQFPAVAGDLEQLLGMIDDGQAVDIKGLSEKLLVKLLRKLFLSLNLKETGDHVFLLRSKASPTLEIVGPIISSQRQEVHQNNEQSEPLDTGGRQESCNANLNGEATANEEAAVGYNANLTLPAQQDTGPKKRVVGPAMPSAELLAAAAKLTEAQAQLRDAELEEDNEYFIGPPPPALVTEAESANEAERFEEVTRIMGAEADNLYDVLGVNRNMLSDNMKKRYWKLSLMVHPDKCSHPEAHQAFVKLNKAYKDLQDPDKRKVLDDKIKRKEEEQELKAGLQAMREAAQWRRLQGISMEGDDVLLAEMEVKVAPKRDDWMTTLPPERKPGGVSMHSTRSFSKSSREGRGDTSAWTDTPSDRAQKAKMNYLEAYNEASAILSKEQEKSKQSVDAELVEQYNKSKRSKSMVEKHKETARAKSKKKSKQEIEKEEWEGSHPWKPWDREKDLTAGRQKVKLDSSGMAEGLTSRFSSGSFQRNFL